MSSDPDMKLDIPDDLKVATKSGKGWLIPVVILCVVLAAGFAYWQLFSGSTNSSQLGNINHPTTTFGR